VLEAAVLEAAALLEGASLFGEEVAVGLLEAAVLALRVVVAVLVLRVAVGMLKAAVLALRVVGALALRVVVAVLVLRVVVAVLVLRVVVAVPVLGVGVLGLVVGVGVVGVGVGGVGVGVGVLGMGVGVLAVGVGVGVLGVRLGVRDAGLVGVGALLAGPVVDDFRVAACSACATLAGVRVGETRGEAPPVRPAEGDAATFERGDVSVASWCGAPAELRVKTAEADPAARTAAAAAVTQVMCRRLRRCRRSAASPGWGTANSSSSAEACAGAKVCPGAPGRAYCRTAAVSGAGSQSAAGRSVPSAATRSPVAGRRLGSLTRQRSTSSLISGDRRVISGGLCTTR
jgi:hypothetical protein